MPDDAEDLDVLPGCVCGHTVAAHEHYRDGSECSICGPTGCWAYRPDRPAVSAELRRVLLGIGAVPVGLLGLVALGIWVGGWAVAAALAVLGGAVTWRVLNPRDDEES